MSQQRDCASLTEIWQQAMADPEFVFACKAQSVRVELAAAVALSGKPTNELAAQLGWTHKQLQETLTGSGDLGLKRIFAITHALGLDFKLAITQPELNCGPELTSATANTSAEKADTPEICQACGEGYLTRYIEREEVECHGQTWPIPLHFSVCDACGAELTNGEQARVNVDAMKKVEQIAKLHAQKQTGSDPH